MDKTSLGDRMKEYEQAYNPSIVRRIPVVIRCDGKGFSKWTKKLDKPFDEELNNLMSQTMLAVAAKIEGCEFGYTQSDEITFVLFNDQSNESEPWFGNRLQKMASVVSSMVTAHFNSLTSKDTSLAYFDARVFGVPNLQEAINCLIWRQNDATKNSVQSACYYEVAKQIGKKTARKKMHGLNGKQQQELLFTETGINWNNYPTKYKRGTACYRELKILEGIQGEFERRVWTLDENIPVFTQDRNFLYEILSKEKE